MKDMKEESEEDLVKESETHTPSLVMAAMPRSRRDGRRTTLRHSVKRGALCGRALLPALL